MSYDPIDLYVALTKLEDSGRLVRLPCMLSAGPTSRDAAAAIEESMVRSGPAVGVVAVDHCVGDHAALLAAGPQLLTIAPGGRVGMPQPDPKVNQRTLPSRLMVASRRFRMTHTAPVTDQPRDRAGASQPTVKVTDRGTVVGARPCPSRAPWSVVRTMYWIAAEPSSPLRRRSGHPGRSAAQVIG